MKRHPYLLWLVALGFLLGIRDGYITLWKKGNPEPVEVFPYRAEMLPETDRKALEQGIPIDSPLRLQELLQDYLS